MDPLSISTSVAGALTFVDQVGGSLLAARQKVVDASKYTHTGSLIDIGKIARVEPICLIDASVVNLDYISDVTQSLQSIFAGYYMQAIELTNNIGSISIAQRLAPFNPHRDTVFENYKEDKTLALEAYKYRLPTKQNKLACAMEASNVQSSVNGGDEIKSTMELSNLSVGKMYNVTLTSPTGNKDNVTVKIAIRIMANSIPTSLMVGMMSFKDSTDMELGERYHAWRSGRLAFFKDLILCKDLVDKHRSMLIKDNSNVYQQILNRENDNFKAGLFNKNPSLATASNLAVLSIDTVAQIEQKIGGKLSNFKTRQQIFDNTNLMIMAVIDPSWERISFYHRGIQEVTQASVKDLKASNKSSNDGVLDMMKAFMAGSGPSI